MNLKIAICDDDPVIHQQLTHFFTLFTVAYDHDFELHHYDSGEEFLTAYPMEQPFHLVFLDIEMKKLDGIQVADAIRKMPDRNTIILFLSNYPSYMQDCFPLHAHRFFIKPITYEIFHKNLLDILEEIKDSDLQLVLMDSQQGEIVINLSDLIYIHANKKYSSSHPLEFHTTRGTFFCRGILNDWEVRLKTQSFFSPSRGYLINLRFIYRFLPKCIEMTNHAEIPLRPSKEREIKDMFRNYLLLTRYRP